MRYHFFRQHGEPQASADGCKNLLFTIQSMRITIGKVAHEDSIAIKGRFDTTAAAAMSEVAGHALTMTLSKVDGDELMQLVIPAQHWKINRNGTNLSYADRAGAALGGVTRVGLHSRNGVSYTLSLNAKHLDRATIDTTLSVLLKYETDINKARRAIGREDRGRAN